MFSKRSFGLTHCSLKTRIIFHVEIMYRELITKINLSISNIFFVVAWLILPMRHKSTNQNWFPCSKQRWFIMSFTKLNSNDEELKIFLQKDWEKQEKLFAKHYNGPHLTIICIVILLKYRDIQFIFINYFIYHTIITK